MIVLQCKHCGHEVDVIDSMRGAGIRCARCGNPLAVKPTIDSAKTGIGTPPRVHLLSILGQGGMGIVFEAIDTNLQRTVALKVMKPEFAQDDAARQRFVREARALASIKSEHVVVVHHVGQIDNLPFLAMEFLRGEPLDEWLKRRGRPTLAEVLRLGIQIGQGLMAAHAGGLIHRDIKPGNVFLETRDEKDTTLGPRVKILDFGLARITRDRSNLTNPGLVLGTPGYMAPEQVEGKPVDVRCDLFSLGCILYELSTGTAPFAAPSAMATLVAVVTKHPKPPRELNPDLPAPFAKLILQLLTKDPQLRPATASDVVAALEGIGNTQSVFEAKQNPAAVSMRRWLVIGLAILGTLLVAAAWLIWSLSR
ncbi:MAG: serine/threonine protein kinase [Planctomycetes bacterium]|nr:serine/threonine protein kinase [Planctomycetota bacterium]